MRVRPPQGEVTVDTSAGEPLSCGKMESLSEALSDLADRIEAVGLTQDTLQDVDALRLKVNYFAGWEGYRRKTVSSWDGVTKDTLLKLAKVLTWCYRADGSKHSPDEIMAELRTLSTFALRLARPGNGKMQGLPCSPEKMSEIVADLRTLASAADASSGKGGDVSDLASYIRMDLREVFGALHEEKIGQYTAWRKNLDDRESPFGALVEGGWMLLDSIVTRRAPTDCAAKLVTLADELDARFKRLCDSEPTADARSKPADAGDAPGAVKPPVVGSLSNPMPKSHIMKVLGIDGRKRFESWAKGKLVPVGENRQLWQVRLDLCASNERAKLEKA